MPIVEHLLRVSALGFGLAGLASARAEECDTVGEPFEVLTYNTWGLPRPISTDPGKRFPGIQRLVEETNADVSGLEEVWTGVLGMLTLPFSRPDGDGDTGLVMVTRHRVEAQRSVRFEAETGFDRIKSKGALSSLVDLPGAGPTWIVVTHLQAGHSEAAATARSAQVEQLLWLVSADGRPAVLVGDLNLAAASEIDARTARKLDRAGFVDAAVATGQMDATYPPSNERFDRILVRDGATRCLVTREAEVLRPATRLSDHLPLRAQIQAGYRRD